jgi:hypothetical protein
MMRAAARLECHHAGRLTGEKVEQFAPFELATENHRTALISAMRMKNVLGDIQTDCDNLRHGRLPQVVFNTSTLAHRCRQGASTPSAMLAGEE